MRVTIIIPTYNERENIAKIIPVIIAQAPEVHVLVVDDNSPDKTYDVVRDMQKTIPNLSLLLREKKEGLGKAYIHAFKTVIQEGKSEAIIMMDADFSHSPTYITALIREAAQADMVIGSRYVRGGKIDGWDLPRRLLSRFGNKYAKLIVGLPIFDYTSGLNLIKIDMLKRIDLDGIAATGYAFMIELKSVLWRAGARLKEVPITLYDRTIGESKISSRIIREGVLTPWKIRFRHMKKKVPLEKYFSDLDGNSIKNKFIFLDIDGTLVYDGEDSLSEDVLGIVRTLSKSNRIYFCSNNADHVRNNLLAVQAGVHYLKTGFRKPSRRILEHSTDVEMGKILVIGDKFLTDGLFAKNIGADFIKVKRLSSPCESWLLKIVYLFDDLLYRFLYKV